ncbi:peroxynitrite isomerase THAP4-like isoform X2 [Rhipicephalus microplus]|uniref:peroxynitrite isomerase THAP4-like isoform X2 n=1 Tax=Rhipicephalus microplus TaxID=6941 RepID=UPI003F6BE494
MRTMPSTCVAVGCQNTYTTAGISFHAFPKSAKLRKLWVIAVRREKWEPSSRSVLCSAHFQDDDFVHDRSIFDQLPVKMKRMLKPGVVPTIFSHRKPASGKPRPAFEKRRRQEIVRNALASAEAVRVSDGHCMPSTSSGALDAYQAGNRTFSPMANAEAVSQPVLVPAKLRDQAHHFQPWTLHLYDS